MSDSIQLGNGRQHFVFGNSNYTFHGNSAGTRNWEQSSRNCKQIGSKLVSIETETEWKFLKNRIQVMTTSEYFIGLKNDSESGEWRWISDNSKVDATKGEFPWAKNEPSGDGNCAVILKDYLKDFGKYNDLHCTVDYRNPGYICESPAVSSGQEGMSHKSCFSVRVTHLVFFFFFLRSWFPPIFCRLFWGGSTS